MSVYQDYYSDLSSDDKSVDDQSLGSDSSSCSHSRSRNRSRSHGHNKNCDSSSSLKQLVGSSSFRDGKNRNRTRNKSCSNINKNDSLWGRTILHIDVDCFYVQCEEIERGFHKSSNSNSRSIPLAIGQKHIVVTCNYAARSLGIKKLMSKQDAMAKCPGLRIVDGSDLRKYKQYSQRIYRTFREVVQSELGDLLEHLAGSSKCRSSSITPKHTMSLPCKKNAMDEMMADISTAVNLLVEMESSKERTREGKPLDVTELLSQWKQSVVSNTGHDSTASSRTTTTTVIQEQPHNEPKTFVFGENPASSIAQITEDQSGASSRIVLQSTTRSGGNSIHVHNSSNNIKSSNSYNASNDQKDNDNYNHTGDRFLAPTRRNVHRDHCSGEQQQQETRKGACSERMKVAMLLAKTICQRIAFKTGFTVSAGLSVSPLLAKLAVISKPNTVNLLLPWLSPQILYSMPLRKVHEIGSRTHRALSKALVCGNGDYENNHQPSMITVVDLLKVPREKIIQALLTMMQFDRKNSSGSPTQQPSSSSRDRALCEQKCDILLDRCRGLDATVVKDDGGGLSKTVSVENSFRRGSITTEEATRNALGVLCSRLPPLVFDRVAWSRNPALAHPTTIRLTIREIHPTSKTTTTRSSRHHHTKSKQASVSTQLGKVLSGSTMTGSAASTAASEHERQARAAQMLRELANPLLGQLLSQRENSLGCLNVTRINLALANFQDAIAVDSAHFEPSSASGGGASCVMKDWNPRSNAASGKLRSTMITKKMSGGMIPSSTPLAASTTARKRNTPSSSLGSSRKFSRTRIDHFFPKKPS